MIFNQSITIIKPGEKTDRSGNTVADWSEDAVTTVPVQRVSVQPAGGSELISNQGDKVITGWELFTRPGVDIPLDPIDRVKHQGKTLEVEGDIGRWPHPTRAGRVHHVEAKLKGITGG